MKALKYILFIALLGYTGYVFAQPMVNVANGKLQGKVLGGSSVNAFLGIPYAQPPVGNLRWREPQPAKNWTGVKIADHFGPQAMQRRVFADMVFRAEGMSEDCLYLNVWAPANKGSAKLPVLVYFYGGGLIAGDGSEPRYDGENMAAKGIVAVTVNYRLGVFGFFAHPQLSKESSHNASGNYGYLDQHAALVWVKQNIAAFGGNPDKITIAGESAGSISVCAQMASPLSKNLIAGAIGESGAPFKPTLAPVPLAEAEKNGETFATKEGAADLAALRAIPAEKLLEDAAKPGMPPNSTTVDGYFFPKTPAEIFAAGEQAHIPILVGWNSSEVPYRAFLRLDAPTPASYIAAVKRTYPQDVAEVLKLYPAADDFEASKSAAELASDRFISYSTWKWADMQAKTGGKPVYRYMFSRIRPQNAVADSKVFTGASHASEIEYALGNLPGNKVFNWTTEDYKASATMQAYLVNFIKTGNPNGGGLSQWPAVTKGTDAMFMNIDAISQAQKETLRNRYLFLDRQYTR